MTSLRWTVGIDEAGRGPLAGPVAIGLVHVREGFDLLSAFPGLNDSKKLSEKKREVLFGLLEEHAATGGVRYRVELRDARDIDEQGIAEVIKDAIRVGLSSLIEDPLEGKVWLDGSLSAPKEYEQETVIGGDAVVPAIMLASVAAKVTRDRLMVSLSSEYPLYGFEKHKGYGTKTHMNALQEHGLCAIHRSSYIHLDRAR